MITCAPSADRRTPSTRLPMLPAAQPRRPKTCRCRRQIGERTPAHAGNTRLARARPGPCSGRRLAGGLPEREQVALAVEEEGTPFAGALAGIVPGYHDDLVGHFQVAHVEGGQLEPASAKRRDGLVDVLDLETHLGGTTRRGAGRREEVKLGVAAHVAQAAVA